MGKPFSIRVLQSFFFIWGAISLFYLVFSTIFGLDILSYIPNSLNYLMSLFIVIDPKLIYFLGVDTGLFPLVVGVGAIICGLGLLQYSKSSLSLTRFYIWILLFILIGYFILTIPSLPSLWKGILELFVPSVWDFSAIIVISLLGELILVMTLISLVFGLVKIQKLLKNNINTRKTFIDRLGILVYLPLLFMIIWLTYASYSFYESLKPHDNYGVPVNAKSPQIISKNQVSPDQEWSIKESPNPPYQLIFTIYDSKDNVINELTYNVKKESVDGIRTIGCNCQVSFKGWVNNYTFVIKTIKEDGSEFEDVIDIKKLISDSTPK